MRLNSAAVPATVSRAKSISTGEQNKPGKELRVYLYKPGDLPKIMT